MFRTSQCEDGVEIIMKMLSWWKMSGHWKTQEKTQRVFYQKIKKIENLRQNVCSKLRSVREILDTINKWKNPRLWE